MYAKILNDVIIKFPYSIGALHTEYPDTSFPAALTAETLAAFGVHKIVETPLPAVDSKTHRQVPSIQKVDGVWTQVWETQPLKQDTASANVRGHRDNLLKDCDWTQVADATVDKAAWAAYRQALRDISAQEGFPFNVVWPAEPA
jgi:hypothetical protein